ncbi:4632_t:CDS:2 [Funneliformis geosporum]|uniref:4632_t:CDS:1 n=1 Tax=Funneliformis geosporum TaxID=1117311 RepID=A0A9W4SP93_9GLOM|nr:4632_t:CDS:2 [Funneliformis geosporum]
MGIKYVLLVSRQGKVRLAKWFNTLSPKEKQKIIKEVTQMAYFVLDELIIAGEMQESSKKSVLKVVSQQDQLEEGENSEKGWPEK